MFLFSESAYTERYMGLPLPTENFRGYQKSSLLEQSKWINGKDFFLAHGMADRNVHFQNSMILAKTLVSHNVPFEQHVSFFIFIFLKRDEQGSPQCARTDLNKRFLTKPMTTTS